MLPETTTDALEKWDQGAELDAVPIVPGLQTAQQVAWSLVFEVLLRWRESGGWLISRSQETRRWTFTLGQFDTWCYMQHLAFPVAADSPAEHARLEAIRSMAYAILREGFANVIQRKSANGTPRILVHKS